MKLFKAESGFYAAQFKDGTGKTHTVTTKCTDKIEAAKVAKRAGVEDLEQAAKSGRLSREVIGRIVAGKHLTLDMCIEPFEEWQKNLGRSGKTIFNNTLIVKTWLASRKMGGEAPATASESDISKWVNNSGGTKFSTRKVQIGSLRAFFAFLSAKGWIVGDPSRGVSVDMDKLSHEQKESEIKLPFSNQDYTKLTTWLRRELDFTNKEIERVANAGEEAYSESGREKKLTALNDDREYYTFFHFATTCSFETGLRLSDICLLEWSCFETAGKLKVWTTKTNKRLEIDLSENLSGLVAEIPVTSPKYLFPEQRKTIMDYKKRGKLSMQFSRLCDRVGIAGKSFHSLRHGNATEKFNGEDKEGLAKKLAEVLTVSQIQQLLGHSSAASTKRYVH